MAPAASQTLAMTHPQLPRLDLIQCDAGATSRGPATVGCASLSNRLDDLAINPGGCPASSRCDLANAPQIPGHWLAARQHNTARASFRERRHLSVSPKPIDYSLGLMTSTD